MRDGREYLRLSADGKRGTSVVGRETVVWDAATGREIARFAAVDGSLSADGKLLAFGAHAPPRIEKGAKFDRRAKPDGDKERDGPLTVVVWDVDKKEKRREITVEETERVGAVISPDGKTLATWGTMHRPGGDHPNPPTPDDTPVQFWDAETGKALGRVVMKKAQPSAVAFAPDGKTAALSNWGGTVLLVDPQTGGVQPLPSDAGDVMALAFAPDGKTLATGTFAGTVRFWDVSKAKEVSSTKCPARCLLAQFVFTSANTAVAWGIEGSKAVVWEVPSGKILSPFGGHSDAVYSFAFTPDGKELLSGISDPAEWIVLRWDPATGKPLGRRELPAPKDTNLPPWRTVNVFPNGTKALVSAGAVSYIYDIPTGKRLYDLGLGGRGNSSHVSTNGELRLTPGGVKSSEVPDPTKPLKYMVVEPATNTKFPTIELPAPGLYQAVRSADGTRLFTRVYIPVPGAGRGHEVVTLWELSTGKKLGEVKDASGPSWAVFGALADNKSAIVTGPSGALRALDLTTGKTVYEIDTSDLTPTVGPVLSADGKRFALGLCNRNNVLEGPNEVRVYDAETGKFLKTYRGHEGLVSALAFSPDGKTLASASHDTTVLLWDLTALAK
jgi:WD40 repeat protein